MSWKEPLKKALADMSILKIRLFSSTGFLSSLYYLLFDTSFYREHRASLLGRIAFDQKQKRPEVTSAMLRRNTHRLEKGLIMEPRRDVFAEGYILETVKVYRQAVEQHGFCNAELRWAHDVLTEYFSVVSDQGRIIQARNIFSELQSMPETHEVERSTPYGQGTIADPNISFEQLKALFVKRRSVRWYEQKPVPQPLLDQAVNAASLAPSACNRQPFFFHYTLDNKKAADIASCAMGTVGFNDNFPALLVVVGDLSNYPAERDRHVIYIDAALASMQLMLALEALGLSSCPINWPDIESRERMLQEKLGLAYHERPVMLMAVGYAKPTGGIPYSQKKGTDLLLREIH